MAKRISHHPRIADYSTDRNDTVAAVSCERKMFIGATDAECSGLLYSVSWSQESVPCNVVSRVPCVNSKRTVAHEVSTRTLPCQTCKHARRTTLRPRANQRDFNSVKWAKLLRLRAIMDTRRSTSIPRVRRVVASHSLTSAYGLYGTINRSPITIMHFFGSASWEKTSLHYVTAMRHSMWQDICYD